MKISNKIPSFSLFFLSSILSHCFQNLMGFTFMSIIILIINDLTIYFGLNNFSFLNFSNINNETENKTETNYSLRQFLNLFVIFLVIYISLGLVALLPLEIVQNAFLIYEEYKEKKGLEELKEELIHSLEEESEDDSEDDNKDNNKDEVITNKENENVNKNNDNVKNNNINDNEKTIGDNDNNNKKNNKVKEIVKKIEDNIPKNSTIIKRDNKIKDNVDEEKIDKVDIIKDNKDKDIDNIDKNDEIDLLNDNNDNDKINNNENKSNESDSISTTNGGYELKGYFRFYLFSISLSIIFKLIFNRIFIPEYTENNKEKANVFFLLFYSISTILSLIFYFIFSTAFRKEQNEKKKIYSSMRFAGYIIYREEIIREESSFCRNCGDIIKQLNYACCCYLCSITYVIKCIFCCKVKFSKYNHYKTRKNSVINKKEEICIIYKVSGKCAWLTDLLTETKILAFVIIIYIIELFNIGFKKVLTFEDKDKDIGNKSFIVNIISLFSMFIFYLIDRYGGKLINKILNKIDGIDEDEDNFDDCICCVCGKEFNNIIIGILPVIFCESILTAIISPLVYYNKMKEFHYYFIPISIGCIEFLKVICLNFLSFHFKINNNDMEIISSSFVFSIYFLIWTAISFIIDLFNSKINKLVLFQFIFSLVIIFGFSTVIFIMECAIKKGMEEEEKKIKNMKSNELDLGLNSKEDDKLEDYKNNNFRIYKDIELSIKNAE